MTEIKNMAYWRSKNKCASKGSYDGGLPNLKAKRSPMKMDPMTAITLASKIKDKKGGGDIDIMPMSPAKKSKKY